MDNETDSDVCRSENACELLSDGNGVIEISCSPPDVAEETHNEATKYPDVPTLRYGVGDHPPIVLSLILALQNVVLSFGMNVLISVTIADLACAERNDPIRAKLFCTSVFVVGLTTVVQSAIGIRLPVLQGVSSSFLVPLLSMKTAGVWSCDNPDVVDFVSVSTNQTVLQNVTMDTKQEMVYYRVTQLQGSLMVSGLVTEVLLGGTGLLGYLVKLMGPITVCVMITSIGLSLYPISIFYSSACLPVAMCGSVIMILSIMYLSRIYVPIPTMYCNRKMAINMPELNKKTKLPVFQLFPIFITVVFTWGLCWALTLTGVFSDDPNDPGYRARTDTHGDLISLSPWFFFPYPGQFGPLRFNTAVFIGFVSSYVSSNIESIGDYMATSRATGTFPPPRHAINRGILTEGVLGMVAGALGAGHATTSYSINIVIIKLTRVASRSVIVLAGVLCMLFGVIGKLGAVMASLPDPVIGGVSIITFGLLVSVGLSSLQKVNLSSTRNLAVLGTSLYAGLVTSEWLKLNKDSINTGYASLDQVLKLILGNQMFVAGITSVILDNTVKGTKEERGMDDMSSSNAGSGSKIDKHQCVYDVPGISQLQRKIRFLRHIPFLQTYKPK
ncbi:solute carrier family 23 member 1-like [Mizuhopecten yessoensis]|uniref:Solute carrier family 23 member 1 n=1 Tax=Mizuhopecten yessoensis TaxID=6573 RepID=A0A210QFZ2_MIZYE|nr:solute carrier family 23 member 1-like [Mizuhopecten yessoensis]OWF47664.1 Solute carrier family 23 member 1 [Mizuhopecten yessoensis]